MKNAFSVQGVVTAWGQAICISRCISRSTSRCEIRSARMQGIAGRRPTDLGRQKGRWPAQRSPRPPHMPMCRPPGSSVRKVIRGLTPPAGHVSPSGRRGAARRGEWALQTRRVASFRCLREPSAPARSLPFRHGHQPLARDMPIFIILLLVDSGVGLHRAIRALCWHRSGLRTLFPRGS